MRNQALFNEIAILTKESEHRYNQGTWGETIGYDFDHDNARFHACDTTACIAGNAIILTTSQHEMNQVIARKLGPKPDPEGEDYYGPVHIDMSDVFNQLVSDKGFDSITDMAMQLLGLDRREANRLFDGDWSPREMEVHEALIMIGEGYDVEDVSYHSAEMIWAAQAAGFECVEDYLGNVADDDDDY